MVGAHPTAGRRRRQRRIQTVQVEKQRAKIAGQKRRYAARFAALVALARRQRYQVAGDVLVRLFLVFRVALVVAPHVNVFNWKKVGLQTIYKFHCEKLKLKQEFTFIRSRKNARHAHTSRQFELFRIHGTRGFYQNFHGFLRLFRRRAAVGSRRRPLAPHLGHLLL